jgi:hypothetical protein
MWNDADKVLHEVALALVDVTGGCHKCVLPKLNFIIHYN